MTAVLLDIGGVILPEDELYARLFQSTKAALRNAGVHVSDEEFDTAIRKCILSFVPDAAVTSVDDLRAALLKFLAA